VLVEIPRKLNEKQRQLLREFSTIEDPAGLPQRKGFMDKLKELFKGEDTQS
jgi:molecular chaperone DnaJ